MAFTSTLTVEELDSNRNTLRTLTLFGPGLPKMGAGWGMENALPTTWYPGNPFEATQQVLVAKELPSDWEGEWNLTRLTRSPCSFADSTGTVDVVSPGRLVDIVEDLARKGQRLRVTWVVASNQQNVDRTVLREGRVKSFNAKYTRSTDVEWTVSFSWVGRGGVQQKVVAARDSDVNAAQGALIAALLGTQAAVQAFLAEQATTDTLGQLEQLAQYPLNLLGTVETFVEDKLFDLGNVAGIVTQFKNLPFNLAAQVVDIAADTIATANELADSFGRAPAEQQILSDNVADLTRSQTDVGEIQDMLAVVARQAASTQSQMRDAVSANPGAGAIQPAQSSGTQPGNIKALRITKTGDTPQSMSRLYYGTIDHDIDILRANQLPWYQVTFNVGSLIIIPVITTSKSP